MARSRLGYLVLAALAASVFAPSFGFGFVNWDDDTHLLANPSVRAPHPESLAFWLTPSFGYPIALPILSYALQYALHGLHPAGYHVGNVLLHALNAVLAARVLERLGLSRPWALAGAALFAVHPLAAEPVSWVSGRKDLLAAAFGLGALECWLAERDVSANVLFVASALSQPAGFGLPLVALLGRGGSRRALAAVAPALAVAAAITVSALWAGTIAIQPQAQAAFPLRMFRTLGYSLALPFRPFALAPVYVLAPARWSEPATLLGVALVLGLLAAYLSRPLRPLLALLYATLLPVANLLPLAKEVGDAHLYLPLVPLCGLFALALERLAARLRPALRVAVAVVLPLALVPATLAQSALWRNGVTLWSAMLARYPDVPQVCSHLGVAYAQAGQPGRALALLEACAQAHHARDFYLYNMVLAARDAGDRETFRALLGELAAKHPEHPLARELREKMSPPAP